MSDDDIVWSPIKIGKFIRELGEPCNLPDFTGNSDPGTSGTLSPYSDMKSFYFDDSDEPDNFRFEFMDEMKKILSKEGVTTINVVFEDKEDYYRLVNKAREFAENGVKVYGTSRNSYEVVLEEEEDLEEKNKL